MLFHAYYAIIDYATLLITRCRHARCYAICYAVLHGVSMLQLMLFAAATMLRQHTPDYRRH